MTDEKLVVEAIRAILYPAGDKEHEWSSDELEAIARVLEGYDNTRMPGPEIDHVLGRIYNAKMKQAYARAQQTHRFPAPALKLLGFLSKKYGDLGYNNGEVGEELRILSNALVNMLGYEYDEEIDDYVEMGG